MNIFKMNYYIFIQRILRNNMQYCNLEHNIHSIIYFMFSLYYGFWKYWCSTVFLLSWKLGSTLKTPNWYEVCLESFYTFHISIFSSLAWARLRLIQQREDLNEKNEIFGKVFNISSWDEKYQSSLPFLCKNAPKHVQIDND